MVFFLFLGLLIFAGLWLVGAVLGAGQSSGGASATNDRSAKSAKRDAARSNQSDDDWSYDYDYDYDYDD